MPPTPLMDTTEICKMTPQGGCFPAQLIHSAWCSARKQVLSASPRPSFKASEKTALTPFLTSVLPHLHLPTLGRPEAAISRLAFSRFVPREPWLEVSHRAVPSGSSFLSTLPWAEASGSHSPLDALGSTFTLLCFRIYYPAGLKLRAPNWSCPL